MIYLSVFIFAFIGTAIFTPISIWLARRFDVLDYPRARKVHRQPLPRWGGIGIYLGFFLSIIILYLSFPSFRELISFKYKSIELLKQLSGMIFGGTLVLILGMIDDKKPVRAVSKLLTQIIAAYLVMDFGVRISGLHLPFMKGYYEFPIIVGQILTVFWILGFMNTINLADGLDGLAAGIVVIASGTFFIAALLQDQTKLIILSKELTLAAILSAGLTGASLGFLLYNFYPAKVFMGDSGALFLGFMLAVISTIGTIKTAAVMSIFIPITVIALPIVDVALSIFRRMRSGMGIMQPDKEHLHHRFLRFGWTQREVVLLMYVFTLILSIGSILFAVHKVR